MLGRSSSACSAITRDEPALRFAPGSGRRTQVLGSSPRDRHLIPPTSGWPPLMVEDHPIEYGSFEGVIPKGNYGAGSVMLWDHGTYQLLGDYPVEQQLAKGDFKFHLTGEKLRGDFALVRTKRGKGTEWLLLKKKDAFASPGWDTEDQARSVASGRTQEEIAQGFPATEPPEATPNRALAKLAGSAQGAHAQQHHSYAGANRERRPTSGRRVAL